MLFRSNGTNSFINGYIGNVNNSGNYYNNGTYNSPGSFTIPIQWGDGGGSSVNYDYVTAKVSGWYKKNSSGENTGYFNYITAQVSVSVQRMNSPVISGTSPIANANQDNKTYSIINSTNAGSYLWSVNNGGTIVGVSNGTTVTIKPPLCGQFTVTCEIKRATASSNYILQGSKVITRDPYNTAAVISGSGLICSSGLYTVTGLTNGEIISSWNISNTTIASLNTTSGSNVTLTKIFDGLVTLNAFITNICGSNKTISKEVVLGKPILSSISIQGGYDNVPYGYNTIMSVVAGNTATSYQWSVVPIGVSCINSSGVLAPGTILPAVNSGAGSSSVLINWGNCAGTFRVRCNALNSCSSANYSDKVVRVFNPSAPNSPCPAAKLIINPNPIKTGGEITVNIVPPSNVPPCNNASFKTIRNIKIFNLGNKLLFENKYNDEELVKLSNIKLEKGYFIMQVTDGNDNVLTENFLVE